jgi:two-component system, cell cycle sensor histidine kinase and response regulator CckA
VPKSDENGQFPSLEVVGRIASGIAHDFNNQLVAVKGYATLLRERIPAGTRAHEDLDQIVLAAERATALARALLTIGSRPSGQPAEISLAEVLDELALLLGHVAAKGIELDIEVEPDLPAIRFDRGELERIVLNLALNARDAMPSGGLITISATRPGRGTVLLRIADTGAGIDPANMPRLFDPFFSTKEPGVGSGLGLSIVRDLAAGHGAHVSVNSYPGAGTAVSLYFPVP